MKLDGERAGGDYKEVVKDFLNSDNDDKNREGDSNIAQVFKLIQ